MFLNYIHSFRGLTIILIVAIHCVYLDFIAWPPDSYSVRIIHSFLHLGSTLFVFIAGFLFQYLSHKYSFKRYITSKLKYVILPYIIVSFPAIIKIIYFPFADDVLLFADYPPIMQVFLYYATGRHMNALWFMPTIIIFYFFAPLLFSLDKKAAFYWFLPLFMLISLVVQREIFPVHNPLQSFVHFFSVYVFGMFVSHYREQVFDYVKRYWWLLVSLVIVLFLAELYYKYGVRLLLIRDGFSHFRWLGFALIAMYFFYRYEKTFGNRMFLLAEMSFGIYFVHSYALTALGKSFSYLQLSLPGNAFTYLFVVALVIVSCMIGLWVTKKIFGGYSRMLVGY